jgi:hypothetical protein
LGAGEPGRGGRLTDAGISALGIVAPRVVDGRAAGVAPVSSQGRDAGAESNREERRCAVEENAGGGGDGVRRVRADRGERNWAAWMCGGRGISSVGLPLDGTWCRIVE